MSFSYPVPVPNPLSRFTFRGRERPDPLKITKRDGRWRLACVHLLVEI